MTALIPPAIVQTIEALTNSIVNGFWPAGGGCINNGGKIVLSRQPYFLKWNLLARYPGMFEAEAKGLSLLRDAKSLTVPEVILKGTTETHQYLLLEYINEGHKDPDYWREFGSGMANLHLSKAETCGLNHDNYIGSLPQENERMNLWVEFYTERRLRPQVAMATRKGEFDPVVADRFERLFSKLPALLPEEKPSLLHGDLWGGNVITTSSGHPCLIDPAVYYGHREVDLAMTQLFGGFDNVFLEAYEDIYPLTPGYRERIDLYFLYPLLVHVNIFGGGYSRQVTSILNRYV